MIMVTAKGSEYDKVIGLDSGADDYVTKPFGMMELVSRIKAVLRRSKGSQERENPEIQGVHIDVKKHEVTVDGRTVPLTLKEFELLEKLMRNEGIVLTRDQLLTEIWGYEQELLMYISGRLDKSWVKREKSFRQYAESGIA